MKMRRMIHGGVVSRHSENDPGEFPRGVGTMPAEWTLDIESIDGNIIHFKDPLPDWVTPGCEVRFID